MTVRPLFPPVLAALIGVSTLLIGAAPPSEEESLARAANTILKTRCFSCHGQNGVAKKNLFILDHARLIQDKRLIPGDMTSPILRQIETGAMPLGADKLPANEIATLRRWIAAGAPAVPDEKSSLARPFLTETALLRQIEADLNRAEKRDRLYLRYFSIAPLYNAGAPEKELAGYRLGLAKLLNSLSWHREITRPTPIDPEKTLLRIDLRDFDWTPDTWKTILAAYPYGVRTPDTERIARISGAALPYVRADWFVASASVPPLYHDILDLPQTVQELESRLSVNVARNLEQGKNAVRSGIRNSGVSRNNRVVERHISPFGAYWRSYDFSTNQGEQNIFKNPLRFQAAGGEMIFHLPNGMQGYFLANATGERLDVAPVTIVFDRNTPEEAEIRNGRSCMACHVGGTKTFKDEMRSVLEVQTEAVFDRDRALALYVPQQRIDAFLREDTERFQRAVEATGCSLSADFRTEPINALARKFDAELTLTHAAAEAGLDVPTFRERIARSRRLAELGFGQLLIENGGLKRDAWSDFFPDVVKELGLGDYIRPTLPLRAVAQNKTRNSPRTRTNPRDGAEMIYIPPGPFLMGSKDGEENEKPVHQVTLSGYYIYKHPVTVAQYEAFCLQTGRPMPPPPDFNKDWLQDNQPMVNVNWSDAVAYCQWAKVSLPSEAQWEKAARGGMEGKPFPWGDEFDRSQLWCSKEMNGDAKNTVRVGSFPPNGYGLHDMAGNIWHWCNDRYDPAFYQNSPDTIDPENPPPGQYRVVRGGSWQNFTPKYFRAAFRQSILPDVRSPGIGFRCVWRSDLR